MICESPRDLAERIVSIVRDVQDDDIATEAVAEALRCLLDAQELALRAYFRERARVARVRAEDEDCAELAFGLQIAAMTFDQCAEACGACSSEPRDA